MQSVTYTDAQGGGYLYSSIVWESICEKITSSEYNSAPDYIKATPNYRIGTTPVILKTTTSECGISIDKNESLAEADNAIGDFYYYYCEIWQDSFNDPSYTSYYYYKCTYNSYKTEYVKVNFLDDESIEICYKGKIIKTFSNGYTITYFND